MTRSGSFIHPSQPQLVIALLTSWTYRSVATLCLSTHSAPPDSSFPVCQEFHLGLPGTWVLSWSVCLSVPPGSPSLLAASWSGIPRPSAKFSLCLWCCLLLSAHPGSCPSLTSHPSPKCPPTLPLLLNGEDVPFRKC